MSAGDPSIISRALAWSAEAGVALATVIQTWGSAPSPLAANSPSTSREFPRLGLRWLRRGGSRRRGKEVLSWQAQGAAIRRRGQNRLEDRACGGTIRIFVEPLEGVERDASSRIGLPAILLHAARLRW